MHQHLAPSVGNDTKSYVGSLSHFHLTTLHRESAETKEPNICTVAAKPMPSIPGHCNSYERASQFSYLSL
ncbi:hypothetical protein ACFX2B_040919 [Malus domestica]